MEISSALPDMNFGFDQPVLEDDEMYLGDEKPRQKRTVAYDKDNKNGDLSSIDIYKPYLDDEDEDDDEENQLTPYDSERRQVKLDSDVEDDESDNDDFDRDENDDEENPLDMDILDASSKKSKAKTVADVWFEQDIFKQALDNEDNDEEFELERKLNALKSDGVTVLSRQKKQQQDSSDSDSDEETKKPKKSKRAVNDDGFEEVPIDQRKIFFFFLFFSNKIDFV